MTNYARKTKRFFLYSHDGVGLGHARRHLAIASALIELAPEAQILIATSVDEVSRLGLPPNVDTLKLPALRKLGNRDYSSRRLGLQAGEIGALRSALLQAAVESFRPAVVLVDKHPFGPGGEFHAALAAAKCSGARAVLGLRDILDESMTVLREWCLERLHERVGDYYDQVLVYGDQAIFDPVKEYRFPPTLAERTQYCGYVVDRLGCTGQPGQCPFCSGLLEQRQSRTVLGTTGGGEDGFDLLKTFVRAAAGASWKGLVVAGPLLGQAELAVLQQLAADRQVALHTFIPCLSEHFSRVDSLVCMGGYNTLVEAVSKGVPTVCVPRVWPRTEQLLRAQAFERLGLLRVLRPEQLSLSKLRHEIGLALETSREKLLERAHSALEFQGARRAAGHLLELVAQAAPGKESAPAQAVA